MRSQPDPPEAGIVAPDCNQNCVIWLQCPFWEELFGFLFGLLERFIGRNTAHLRLLLGVAGRRGADELGQFVLSDRFEMHTPTIAPVVDADVAHRSQTKGTQPE